MWVLPPGMLCPTTSALCLSRSSFGNCLNRYFSRAITFVDFCVLAFGRFCNAAMVHVHLVIGALQISDVIRYMTVSWVSTPQYSNKRQASNLHFPHCIRPHLLLLAQDTGYTKQTHGHDYETDRQIQLILYTFHYDTASILVIIHTHTHTHTPI